MGRPTLCNEEIAEQVAALIRQYGFVKTVLMHLGLHPSIHYEWMSKGEDDAANGVDSCFSVYADTIKKALAAFQFGNQDRIRTGSQGWQSSAWMLERSDPEQFALRQKVEHSGEVATSAPLTPAELRDRVRREAGVDLDKPH
jgi:hypothetical protein